MQVARKFKAYLKIEKGGNNMERETVIKPCPICMTPMTVRRTSSMADGGCRKWFFFVYCSQCGHGPNNAFDTIHKAINHWNETALTPCVMRKQYNPYKTYPHMFS